MRSEGEQVKLGLLVWLAVVCGAGLCRADGAFVGPERHVAPGYQIGPAANVQPVIDDNYPFKPLAVAWGGTDFMVLWNDGRDARFEQELVLFGLDVYGGRVAPDGNVLDMAGLALNRSESFQLQAATAWNGTHYLVAWTDMRGGYFTPDIYFTLATSDGQPLAPDGVLLCGAEGDQSEPDVIWTGQEFVVIWQDARSGDFDLYTARVAPDGTVLDPGGLAFYVGPGDQMHPEMAWDQSRALVTWEHYTGAERDVWGQFYDPATPGGLPFPICAETGEQGGPAVAWNGSSGMYLVVWHDDRNGNLDVYARVVTGDGYLLWSFPVADTAAPELYPAAASDGRYTLVVYQEGFWLGSPPPDVRGAVVYPLAPQVWPSFPIAAGAYAEHFPAVDFKRSDEGAPEYLVAWGDTRDDEADVFAARVATDGTVLDPGGFRVSSAAQHRQDAAVGFDGSQYLVAWSEWVSEPGVACARVAADGTPIDIDAIRVVDLDTWERCPQVASTPFRSLVIWQDERNFPTSEVDIYGAWVDPDGVVYPPGEPLCTEPGKQIDLALAWDGANSFLVAYAQKRYGEYSDVWGLIVHADGSPIIGPFPICQAPLAQTNVHATFGQSDFMVVWQDERNAFNADLYAARVAPDGTVLDPDGRAIVVSDELHERYPRVSWNGQNYLAVYERNDGSQSDTYGVRLAPDGSVLTEPFPILLTPGKSETWADVSWDGIAHVVAVSYLGEPELCAVVLGPGADAAPTAPVCFEPQYGARFAGICAGTDGRDLLVYESLTDPPYGSYRILSRWFVSCLGDLDGDADVDLADLAILLAHYGTAGDVGYEQGDLDGDGDVDLADLASLLAVYGTTCP